MLIRKAKCPWLVYQYNFTRWAHVELALRSKRPLFCHLCFLFHPCYLLIVDVVIATITSVDNYNCQEGSNPKLVTKNQPTTVRNLSKHIMDFIITFLSLKWLKTTNICNVKFWVWMKRRFTACKKQPKQVFVPFKIAHVRFCHRNQPELAFLSSSDLSCVLTCFFLYVWHDLHGGFK